MLTAEGFNPAAFGAYMALKVPVFKQPLNWLAENRRMSHTDKLETCARRQPRNHTGVHL